MAFIIQTVYHGQLAWWIGENMAWLHTIFQYLNREFLLSKGWTVTLQGFQIYLLLLMPPVHASEGVVFS